MRHLHESLRSNHHLKHGGRIQYGLFVKGIGLSLEHSLKFWREEFTKNMDIDKVEQITTNTANNLFEITFFYFFKIQFEKQYSYTIRHNYGKEGKRVNYLPHSCMKIINSSVGPGENHGCPFKHFDSIVLKQKLTTHRVPQQGTTI